ncbi:Leucine-rich repeat (LRR) protein [Chryseobacterium vietnamense]|uniref:leucine-rich repeat domain-containing protein n=1 Tax=Chryseobacterium vietnamense TaxID=866785 RepID=UPI0028542A1E|nr:hypothetical protein [Chryseobacterium vietnamense]MDR6488020.1 Leucine-rich repeat (LRR) protein [Chryseobacterium vietnamense]
MVTDKQLKKITEKIVKAQAKTSRETSLDLSGLSIDSETLDKVMPEILKIQNLTKLDLSKNKLTGLPNSIGELSSLTQLIAKNNSIQRVPNTLANLGNLERLDFAGNSLLPKSDDLVNYIRQIIPDVTNRYKNALSKLYPNDKEQAKIAKQIEASDLDPSPIAFEINLNGNNIQNTMIKSSKNAIKLFLSKVPVHNEYELNVYSPTVKMLLSQLRDPNIPVEDRNTIQLGITSSLGNCDTPVKEHLMRMKIAELLKSGEKLSEENYLMIERLALIEATGKLKNLPSKEKIEAVNALVSLVYSEKHIQSLTKKLDIQLAFLTGKNNSINGKQRDLPLISVNAGYGLALLTPKLIDAFAALVGKKTGPFCILNEEKLKELTDNYLTGKGLQNDTIVIEREKYIQKYPEDMQTFIMEDSDLSDTLFSADMDEVGDLMNFPGHQEVLRGLLKNENKEESIKQKYEEYVSEQQNKIKDFVDQKLASQNTQADGQGMSTEKVMSDHNRYHQMASPQIQSQTETQRRELRTLSTSARHGQTEIQREESRTLQGSTAHRR